LYEQIAGDVIFRLPPSSGAVWFEHSPVGQTRATRDYGLGSMIRFPILIIHLNHHHLFSEKHSYKPEESTIIMTTFNDLADAATKVLGKLDMVNIKAEPYPWFSRDINRDDDIQWGGYIGPIFDESKALVFGFNLEYIASWKRIFPKLCRETDTFTDMLKSIPGYEWHWWGRSAVVNKNPKVRVLAPPIRVEDVNVNMWLSELEDILEKKKGWSAAVTMRPQIQIMHQVGLIKQASSSDLLIAEIQKVIQDLKPIALFLEK